MTSEYKGIPPSSVSVGTCVVSCSSEFKDRNNRKETKIIPKCGFMFIENHFCIALARVVRHEVSGVNVVD